LIPTLRLSSLWSVEKSVKADFRVGGFLRLKDLRQLIDARVGHFDDAEMDFFFAAKAADLCLQTVSMLKNCRLAGAAMADQNLLSFRQFSCWMIRNKQSNLTGKIGGINPPIETRS
jgi:hypothetical protein